MVTRYLPPENIRFLTPVEELLKVKMKLEDVRDEGNPVS